MEQLGKQHIPRQNRRYSICLMASLQRKDRGEEKFLCECDVYDLSVKGCRIFSEIGLKSGKFLGLKLMLPHQEFPIQVNLSYIRWTKNGNSGLEFRLLTAEDQERLHHYVAALHTQIEHAPFP